MRTNGELVATVDRAKPVVNANLRTSALPKAPLPVEWFDDLQLDQDKPALVEGLLEAGAYSVWYGAPKSGKTFVVMDLAMHIASGRAWRGMPVLQGVVVYLAAEAGRSVKRRAIAARSKFGPNVALAIVPCPIDLLDPAADTGRVIDLVRGIAAERGPVVLVVVDTLSRAMPGGDENKPECMTRFVANIDRIRLDTGAHGLVIHHSGKDAERGMRGHTSNLGALDTAIEIKRGSIRVECQRDLPEGDIFAFELEVVEIGASASGRPITSCIVREIDGGAARVRKPQPMGKNQKLAMDALWATIADGTDPTPIALDIPKEAKGCTLERWRASFDRYMPELEPKRRTARFSEASRSLAGDRIVHHVAGFVWPA